jgi:cobalt-zinc-cadmium efflux system membrane fusion protein
MNTTARVLIFGILATAAAIAGCRRPEPAPAPPAATVDGAKVIFPTGAPQLAYLSVETAEPRGVAVAHLTGRLYWDDDSTVRIFTPVAGQVIRVLADIGQPVAVGQPLAEINSPDFGQARADARTAVANLAAADKADARARDLLAHGAAAEKDVEAAEAAFQAALAERDRAVSRLRLYGGTIARAEEVYRLRSPLAGVVVEKNINPGQEVRADQMLANATNLFAPLFVVTQPNRLWLQIDVAETDLPAIRPGQALQVSAPAYPDRTFVGRIDRIAATLDPATRTAQVRGVVENPRGLLKAEMYVRVDVIADRGSPAARSIEIPGRAIFIVQDQSYLFVQTAPGVYERRAVTVGTERDGLVPVYRGLAAGEAVVVEGGLLLQSVLEPAE